MKKTLNLLLALFCMMCVTPAFAEVSVEFGLTGGAQSLNKDQSVVTQEGLGSMDIVVDAEMGPGVLHVYIEGASDAAGTAAEAVDGANLDAGTAADANGKGRVQISELSYVYQAEKFELAMGVQNLFAFADANSTSNAETEQFMAASLVNNPTIAMPDYTVSAVLNVGEEDSMNATFMVGNGYGMADNDAVDYEALLDFGPTPDGFNKGIFALGEVRFIDQGVWLSLGAWSNDREVDPLTGFYANLDSPEDEDFQWSLRYGVNDDEAGISSFTSFSTAFAMGGSDVFGLAVASHKFPSTVTGVSDPALVEMYYRWQLTDSLALTPDVQYWQNANGLTDTTAGIVGGNVIVYGLRLQYSEAFSF